MFYFIVFCNFTVHKVVFSVLLGIIWDKPCFIMYVIHGFTESIRCYFLKRNKKDDISVIPSQNQKKVNSM